MGAEVAAVVDRIRFKTDEDALRGKVLADGRKERNRNVESLVQRELTLVPVFWGAKNSA